MGIINTSNWKQISISAAQCMQTNSGTRSLVDLLFGTCSPSLVVKWPIASVLSQKVSTGRRVCTYMSAEEIYKVFGDHEALVTALEVIESHKMAVLDASTVEETEETAIAH